MTATPVPIIDGCWVDLFELSQFRGSRRRLFGPGSWNSFRSRTPNWGTLADSMQVGPRAYVHWFDSRDFERTVIWFLPGEHVRDLLHHLGDEIDSLGVSDVPPQPEHPGHQSYLLAAARLK
jgi:hypothetical protein